MKTPWLACLLILSLLTTRLHAENRLYDEPELPIAIINAGNPERLEVQPSEFTIDGSRQQLQLVVTGFYADGTIADLTRAAQYRVVEPSLAEVNARGGVLPRANGQTSVEVTAGNVTASMTLHVKNSEEPENVSFHFQMLPILSKAGCSMGACHGSPHGKGGFRLSLRAFDPALDYKTIVEEEFGRRVNLLEPEKSLLLAKPRNTIAHGGGQRLHDGDLEQTLLTDWIKEGCEVDQEAATCVGIHVTPSSGRYLRQPHHVQQFRVTAQFADDTTRDITHLAVFESSDETVCRVSRHGLAVGMRRGEAAVIVRYLDHIESVVLGFVEDVPDFQWTSPPPVNYVDEHVYAKLKKFQYLPSQPCDDATFLRRVSLDLTGLLPPVERTQAFLRDEAPDKRARLIDELIESDEHAAFWAQKWGDLLRLSTRQMGRSGVLKFHRWILDSVASNQPYDQFAREILLATGSTLSNPAGNFYRTGTDTSDIMESTSQLFLGTRIGCAKCHNHPYERWTQDNYYGLSAFFNRIATRQTGRGDEAVVWMKREGHVMHPVTGKPVTPWIPSASPTSIETKSDHRKIFTDWLTSPQNPFFAKVEVNRIVSHLLGSGIVEPFDDHRDTNPPANAPLLDALANDFVKHGFDRRHIIRTILNSQSYQTSSHSNQFNQDDTRFFSHYQPRRLTAEQLIDAFGELTGVPERFPFVHPSTKATQLPAPDLKPHDRGKIGEIEFLKVFGMPERQSVCQCERGEESSLGQALELFNGETIHRMLSNKQNRIHKAIEAKTPHDQIVNDLYLRAFSRLPTDQELKITLTYLNNASNPGDAFEDIAWAMVNQDEFLFQH